MKDSLIQELVKIKDSNNPSFDTHMEDIFESLSKLNTVSSQSRNLGTYTQNCRNAVLDEHNLSTNLQDESKVEGNTKKSLLMLDLFENISDPKETQQTVTSQQSLKSMHSTGNTGNTAYVSNEREPRRSKRNSKIINDPFGLLHSEFLTASHSQSDSQFLESGRTVTKNTTTKVKASDLPEWLGGGKKLEAADVDVQEEASKTLANTSPELHDIQTVNLASPPHNVEIQQPYRNRFPLPIDTPLDQQERNMAIQQKQHEIKTPTMLFEENDQLQKLVEIQRSKLAVQEQQFNILIKTQLERQNILEKQIKMQQEHIDQYIRTIIAQPISGLHNTSPNINMEKSMDNMNYHGQSKEMEYLLHNVQLEKSELNSILCTINENHKLEMLIQKESYKRQINFLQEITEKFDKKMRQELELLEIDNVAKLEKWRDEKRQLNHNHKEEIEAYKKKHVEEIEKIHETHLQNIKLLQKEHSDSMKNICLLKKVENQLIETITSRNTDIDDLLQKASLVINNIKDLQNELEKRNDDVIKLRENHLKMREDELKQQQQELRKQRNTLDLQFVKIIGTTNKLDSRVMELIAELQKLIAYYNDMEEILGKKSRHILQERELLEERINWEREHLQTLRECWLKEQERQLKALTEEKEIVATERLQLEFHAKLKTDSENIAKIELKATIKAAQDAIKRANEEKVKWQELTTELEAQKQHLEEKERILLLRAKQLDNLTRTALAKKEEGVKALEEAKQLEDQRKKEFDVLRVQLRTLTQCERKITSQKSNFIREKFLSQGSGTEQPVKYTQPDYTEDLSSGTVRTDFTGIIDPRLTMLRLHLNDQLCAKEKFSSITDG